MRPPLRRQPTQRSAAGAAQIEAIRRNRRNAQIRNALLCMIGLGGLWFGVQKFGVIQNVVVTEAPTQTAPRKPIAPQTPQAWGTSQSEVSYNDLLAKGEHSPTTT